MFKEERPDWFSQLQQKNGEDKISRSMKDSKLEMAAGRIADTMVSNGLEKTTMKDVLIKDLKRRRIKWL